MAAPRAVLDEHRRVWEAKPVLADVYRVWFELLQAEVAPGGVVLEVGAGPGFLQPYVRQRRPDLRWVATDIVPTPWHDVTADCLQLPLGRSTLDAVVGLDILHHLAAPARFFTEAARTLRTGGRLAVVEPWVTPLSYPIYRFLHREGCTLGLDPWNPFSLAQGEAKDAFDGDTGVVWRLVRATGVARWREMGFGPPRVHLLNSFAYLLSLGFQPRSLLPRPAAPLLLALDRALGPAAAIFGMRAFVVWTREDSSPSTSGAP